jgi:hypothetical protein
MISLKAPKYYSTGKRVSRRLTFCSAFPTPMTNTFPPKAIDCNNPTGSDITLSKPAYTATTRSLGTRPAPTHKDARPDRTLHPSTLQSKLQFHPSCGLPDLDGDLFGRLTPLDEDGLHARMEGLGEIETRLEEVGDDDRGRTEGFGGEEGD